MRQKPKIHKVEQILATKIFKLEEVDLEFSNGAKRTYQRIRNRGQEAVVVVPVLNDDQFLLIREYAVGIEQYELSFVKGVVDPGESIEAAADRELKEEAGYGAKQLEVLKTVTTSPGYMTNVLHIVLARDLFVAKLEGDEPEELEVVPWAWSNLEALIARKEFSDARAIAGILLVKDFLKKGVSYEK